MKRFLLSTITVLATIAATATVAVADGPGESYERPPLIEPVPTKSGLYLGIGVTKAYENGTECVENDYAVKVKSIISPCVAFDFFREDGATATGFAQVLHDAGTLVFGGEVGVYDGDAYAGALAGLDLGAVMPYVGMSTEGENVGVKLFVSERFSVGAKYVFADDYERPELRASFKF